MLLGTKRVVMGALVASALMCSSVYAGGTIDLSLSNDTFRAAFDGTRVGSGVHLNAAWLHDEDKGEMGTVGFHVVETKPRNKNLYIGVGGNANFVHLHKIEKDTGAVAIGGFFRYNIPAAADVSVAGYVYYAPKVLSFADTENMINTDLRLQYSLIPSARAFVGYRYVGYRLEDDSKRHKIGDGLHLGLSLDF